MCVVVEYVVLGCVWLVLVLFCVFVLESFGECVLVVWNDSVEVVWVVVDVMLLLCCVCEVIVLCCEVLGVVFDDLGGFLCDELEVLCCWLVWYGIEV